MQQAISPGTVINHRYQIQKQLQENTGNCRYLAEDTDQSNRLVVISFPRIELLILTGFASAFKGACESLSAVRVNGLVKILDNGLHDSRPYAVLQHVSHDSLETLFREHAEQGKMMSLDAALDWARPLAVCLDELHEADYIHSNVRPANVYIGPQLLLGDFITEFTLQRMGKFKNAIGTLDVANYLAPEYLKSNYTGNYDQYMLATTIYQGLAGQAPFAQSGGGEDYRMQVATHMPESLQTFRPELQKVSEVLAKALARNPAQRYASCRDLVSELQAVQPAVAKVVSLTPAATGLDNQDQVSETISDFVPVDSSARVEAKPATGKKGLLWVGAALLGAVAVAYTVLNLDSADQITSHANNQTDKPEVVSAQVAKPMQASVRTTTSDVTSAPVAVPVTLGNLELKTLIEQEAKLAHQALSAEAGSVVQTEEGDTYSGLGVAISSAVTAGQQEFLESRGSSTAQNAPINVGAITAEVSEAVADGETSESKQAARERLNQELLAVQALVNQREAAAKARAAAKSEAAQAEEFVSAAEQDAKTEASIKWDESGRSRNASNSTKDDDTPDATPVMTERERIRAFKKKELARIKAVTDKCVVGGRMHREAAAGNLGFIKSCMAVGVDPNIAQSNHWTLLHIAARSGYLNMSKLLLAKGARINAKSASGLTALDMAVAQKKARVVSYLRSRGATSTR